MDYAIAIFTVITIGFGFWMYFRGAKKQLEQCMRLRHCEWMTDDMWEREADISKSKDFL